MTNPIPFRFERLVLRAQLTIVGVQVVAVWVFLGVEIWQAAL